MKRLAPAVLLLAALAVACGGEDEKPNRNHGGAGGDGGSGGSGGTIEPQPPTFAGLDEARFLSPDTAQLYWLPAEDVETPGAELTYKVLIWANNPAAQSADPQAREYLGNVETDCNPRCRYNYTGLTPGDVKWFAVEVTDADGMSAGRANVRPVVIEAQPVIDQVVPDTADVGSVVMLQGNFFLDERLSADSLVLNGRPVDPAFVESWDNRAIRMLVPAGHGSGALTLEVKTPGGSATATLNVNE